VRRGGAGEGAVLPLLSYQGTGAVGPNQELGQITPIGKSGSGGDISANAFWQLDLWGRIRRLNESELAQFLRPRKRSAADALARQRRGHRVLRIGRTRRGTANRAAQRRVVRRKLELFSARLAGGAASKLETDSAEGALASWPPPCRISNAGSPSGKPDQHSPSPQPGRRPASGGPVGPDDAARSPAGLPSDLLERRRTFVRPNNSCAPPTPRSAQQGEFLPPG